MRNLGINFVDPEPYCGTNHYPRIKISTRRHERLQMVSLHEEHGVSELHVLRKCREIIVNLSVQISPAAVNIPLDGAIMEVRSPDNGYRG